MSRASDTTDPIEAAEDDIAGSKDLIASVADEINQHQRWLENYRVAEKERARRLKRQELMYQLELRRRRTVRSLKRFSLASLRLARRVVSVLVRNGTALVVALGHLLERGATWTAPRARALALTLWRWSVAASAWTWRTAVALTHALFRAASISFAWIAVQYRALDLALGRSLAAGWSWTWRTAVALTRALFRAASISSSWIVVQYRALDLAVGRSLAAGWSWTLRNTRILARALFEGASISFSWIAAQSRALDLAVGRSLAAGWSWTWRNTRILARAFLRAASIGFAWIALKASVLSGKLSTQARHGAYALRRSALRARQSSLTWISTAGLRMGTWRKGSPVVPQGEKGGNGLGPELAAPEGEPGPLPNEVSAAQHGTALICVEPLRARLPVVRAS